MNPFGKIYGIVSCVNGCYNKGMMIQEQEHFSYKKEKEGCVDFYLLAPGIGICFDQIYTNSWTKGDSSLFSDQMLIFNFCVRGRCDASLAANKYAIVKEGQICVSTHLPTKDFYYPGRLYEGVQIYIDRAYIQKAEGRDFVTQLGIPVEDFAKRFCKEEGLYVHRMSDALFGVVKEIWEQREKGEIGFFRYGTVRLLHELLQMPCESESRMCFTRSQIAIVKEAEALVMEDLSKRITAKEMAEHFGISESSFKLYAKGILGDSYHAYFNRKRMEKAAMLLSSTDLKIIAVANAVGYENQGKFARVFAEIYGVPPLEYRRLSKGREENTCFPTW